MPGYYLICFTKFKNKKFKNKNILFSRKFGYITHLYNLNP